MPLPLPPTFQQGMSVTAPASYIATYGVKMPTLKANGDIESFLDRFEQFFTTKHVDVRRKANLLLSALEEAIFTVVKRTFASQRRLILLVKFTYSLHALFKLQIISTIIYICDFLEKLMSGQNLPQERTSVYR